METEQEAEENGQAEEAYQDEQQESLIAGESTEQELENTGDKNSTANRPAGRTNFFHGLAVGVGIGCIANFAIVWISVFFAPQLPAGITYENLLSIFVYPLIYLLAVGLIALTAGVVREYYTKNKP